MSVFGFAQTNVGLVVRRCREVVGSANVQLLHGRESLLKRRCYVVLSITSLEASRAASYLSGKNTTVAIVDAAPSLRRVPGIQILDSSASAVWSKQRLARFDPLIKDLDGVAGIVKLSVEPDQTLDMMIAETRERSVLDKVLAAARTLAPQDRLALHKDTAYMLAGKIPLNRLRDRCLSRGSSGKSFEAMMTALSGETAARLGAAVRAHMLGDSAAVAAANNNVEASEVRFVRAHLND